MDALSHDPPSGYPAIRLGLGKEHRRPGAPLAVDNETTAWEIYNNRAFAIDRELIKDWNDSLNTLLIFAALYSAVLTAFITESMKLIQEDATETTRDILLVVTRQLANSSVAAFDPQPFSAPEWAVRVNYYFFTAISSTLVAALAAVLALQWVGSYDAGLNQSSPEERALQRHFRYQGVEKWRMVQIIAFLPALIFIALFLFFIGLTEWMWNLHKGVAGIIMAGLVFGASLFFITTIISMVYVEAPFRTPASRSFPTLVVGFYRSLAGTVSSMTIKGVVSASRRIGQYIIRTMSELSRHWEHTIGSLTLAAMAHLFRIPRRPRSFDIREKEMVRSIADIKPKALIWLANSVDVLPHTADWFRSIIRELLLLPAWHLYGPDIRRAPWGSISRLLLSPYQTRSKEQGLSEQEVLDLDQTWQLSTLLYIPSVSYYWGDKYERLNVSTKILAQIGLSAGNRDEFFMVNQVCNLLSGVGVLPTNFIAAHLSILYDTQKEALVPSDLDLRACIRDYTGSYKPFSAFIWRDSAAITPPVTFPDEIMDILLDILALRFLGSKPPGDLALDRYITASEFFFQGGQQDYGVHDAIISQILGCILRRLQDSEKVDLVSTLQHILRLLREQPMGAGKTAIIAGVFEILVHFESDLWNDDSRLITARLYALILPSAYAFTGENLAEWRVRFYTGLSALLQSKGWSTEALKMLTWKQVTMELSNHEPKPRFSNSQTRRLWEIPNPILWLYASIGTGPQWRYPSTVPMPLLRQDDRVQSSLESWSIYKRHELHYNGSEPLFTRSVILANRHQLYYNICYRLVGVQTIDGNAISSSIWFSLLRAPVLGIFVRLFSWHVDMGMNILLRVCMHTWFFAEFNTAGGLDWLVKRVPTQRAVTLICFSLDSTESEESIKGWMQCLYSLLISRDYIGGIKSPEMFTDAIARMYSAQRHHRATRSRVPITSNSSATTEQGNGHIYVRNWSNKEWEQWQGVTGDILDGLRRGYIRFAPSESDSRFPRDPDGGCFRSC